MTYFELLIAKLNCWYRVVFSGCNNLNQIKFYCSWFNICFNFEYTLSTVIKILSRCVQVRCNLSDTLYSVFHFRWHRRNIINFHYTQKWKLVLLVWLLWNRLFNSHLTSFYKFYRQFQFLSPNYVFTDLIGLNDKYLK